MALLGACFDPEATAKPSAKGFSFAAEGKN
jgi:hypothetical protein